LQFAPANATAKIAKEYVFSDAKKQVEQKKPAYNNAHKKLLNPTK